MKASLHLFSNRIFKGRKNSSPTLTNVQRSPSAPKVQATYRVLTVTARRGIVGIVQIATKCADKTASPCLACLTRGGVEHDKFIELTPNRQTATKNDALAIEHWIIYTTGLLELRG